MERMAWLAALFAVRPHAKDPDVVQVVEDLAEESMLDVDSARVCASEIADQVFVRGWHPAGIFTENLE